MPADEKPDVGLLNRFEQAVAAGQLDAAGAPARVLFYGRAVTVLAFDGTASSSLAYKRIAPFRSDTEADRYESVHRKYVRALGERAGLRTIADSIVRVRSPGGQPVLYIVQRRLPEDTICNLAVFRLTPPDVSRLVASLLHDMAKVFDFNRAHQTELELGLDGELSNWALGNFDPDCNTLPDRITPLYLDTCRPFMRKGGEEQFDTEWIVRTLPSPAQPVFRRTYLPSLVDQLYSFRRSAVALVATFLDEGREDLMPGLLDAVNWYFLADRQELGFKPITSSEVRSHHRRDQLAARASLSLRRADRRLNAMRGRPYPQILPARWR
jgi:hypothetical protein